MAQKNSSTRSPTTEPSGPPNSAAGDAGSVHGEAVPGGHPSAKIIRDRSPRRAAEEPVVDLLLQPVALGAVADCAKRETNAERRCETAVAAT